MTDLDVLYREYVSELRRFAHRRVPDAEAASDLVQEAFAKYVAAEDREQSRRIERPELFLRKTITNLAIDGARRKERSGWKVPLGELDTEVADGRAIPEKQAERRERVARLLAGLEGLPEREQHALVRNRLDGVSHAEIARELGVSASMVSKYIMSALGRLRAHMGDGGETA